jgi:hypothetical protein
LALSFRVGHLAFVLIVERCSGQAGFAAANVSLDVLQAQKKIVESLADRRLSILYDFIGSCTSLGAITARSGAGLKKRDSVTTAMKVKSLLRICAEAERFFRKCE